MASVVSRIGSARLSRHFLEFSQCGLATRKDRHRRPFGIAQGIGNAMRGQRIAEEAGIADQHPAGAVCLPQSAWRAAEGLQAPDRCCRQTAARQAEAPALPAPAARRKDRNGTPRRNRSVGTEATMQASPSLVGMTPPLRLRPKYQWYPESAGAAA